MKLSDMNEKETVQSQYRDDTKLNIRKELHRLYSNNQEGFSSWLFKQYPLKDNIKVLEFGSGNGDMWEPHIVELSSKMDITLSDFSDGMVTILEEKYKNIPVTIKQINIESIPFEDSSYDIVIANMMLYHVPNIQKGLSEVSRVLKKGGLFFAATFGECGLTEYILNVLYKLNILEEKEMTYHFTLQNGKKQLNPYFKKIILEEYKDGLKVTCVGDLIQYIKTMQIVGTLSLESETKLHIYFRNIIEEKGCIEVPKEYGTFQCIK